MNCIDISETNSSWLNFSISVHGIYIFYLELPLYNGGTYHQGRSSGTIYLYFFAENQTSKFFFVMNVGRRIHKLS